MANQGLKLETPMIEFWEALKKLNGRATPVVSTNLDPRELPKAEAPTRNTYRLV